MGESMNAGGQRPDRRAASGKTSSGRSGKTAPGRRTSGGAAGGRASLRRGRGRKARKRQKRLLRILLLAAAVIAVAAAGIIIYKVGRIVSDAVGPEDYTVSTAEFRKDGSIRVTSVESFEQAYYDADELAQEIRSSVEAYNEKKGDTGIREESFEAADGSAKAVLIYTSADDYENFNETTLFMGTVQEAENAGFDFESIMQAVSNEDSSRILTQATLDQLLSNETIILTEQMDVVLPKKEKFLYATPNLGVTDFQHAAAIDTISDEKPAIIILQ